MYALLKRLGVALPALLVSLLVLSAFAVRPAAAASGHAPAAVPAATATITVTPPVSTRGGLVSVSGSGFVTNETVVLAFDGNLTYSVRVQATAAGQLPATNFTVPSVSGPGAHRIVATGTTSQRSATAVVIVEQAMIVATPTSVSRGGLVSVSGAGFAANERVDLTIDGVTTPITAITATAAGALSSTSVMIPYTATVGERTLTATGLTSHRTATARVVLTSVMATLVATPATTSRGGTTTLTGANWAPNEAITVTLSSVTTPITVVHATAQGAFPSTVVTIPYTATRGAQAFTATGELSKRTATAAITLGAVAATLVATPSTTNRGGTTTLTGGNWAPDEAITVTLSGVTTPITVVHATAQGAFPSTVVTIPYTATQGTQTLTATGAVSKRTATATVTLAAVTATFAVTPAATNRGGLITLSGGSFAANEAVTVTVDGVITPLATITATAQGTLSATGVSIPYSIPAGPHTLRATGAVSKRAATAGITIAALTPSISVSPSAAAPGATVTVTGQGFGRQEQVTLALNGAAISTTAPITTNNGAFSVSFTVPSTVLNGQNTISAVGNESRVTAVTALTGNLARAPLFYFAGGINTATEHSVVQVLNTNNQPADLTLHFYSDNGTITSKTATVAAHTQAVIPVSQYGLPSGTFGLQLNADRQVSAQLTIERDGRDGDTLLGNTGLGTTWYLAEGYTGLTFHENVSIMNPDPSVAAHVQLQLLPFGGHAGRSVTVTVAPHSNSVTDINALLPGQSLSIIATSDRPVVVERTLTFSTNGYGMTTRAGSNSPATSWIFAEGTTVNRFQTYLTLLNPNVTPALVTASFYSRTGTSLGSRTILVTGRSRANLKLNDLFSASGVASVVTSNQPIVVERPEYFGSPNGYRIAGSDVFGRNGAGVRWSFPAGDTQGRSEFLLVYNPSATTVPIDVTAYGSDGRTLTQRIAVPPTVRYNIDVGRLFPGLAAQHGIVLTSASGAGFVAEQTVFAPDHSTLRSTQGLGQ